jgi:hypothetical protein
MNHNHACYLFFHQSRNPCFPLFLSVPRGGDRSLICISLLPAGFPSESALQQALQLEGSCRYSGYAPHLSTTIC